MTLVAVTLGADGSHWLTRDAQGGVPGLPVAAIDTTGAGDAFMAGLLAGLLDAPGAIPDPAALDRICRIANAVGALATTKRGAIPAMPDREAVARLLA